MKRKTILAFITAVICAGASSCSVNLPGKSDNDAEVSVPEAVTEASYMAPATETAEEITTESAAETSEEEAVTEPAEEEVTAESLIDNVDYFAHKYEISKGTISETCSLTAYYEGQSIDYTIWSNYSYSEYDETAHVYGTISTDLSGETLSQDLWSTYADGYTTIYRNDSESDGWFTKTGIGKSRSYLRSTHFYELALEENDDQYIIKGKIKYAFLNQNLFGVIIPYGFENAERSTYLDMTMYYDKETKEFKSYTVDFTPLLEGTQADESVYHSFMLTVTMDGYEEGTLEIPEDVKNSAVQE